MGNNKRNNRKLVSNRNPNQNKQTQHRPNPKESVSNAYKCKVCRHPHALSKCKRFLQMNIVERIRAVRKYHYCFNCLAQNHSEGHCLSTTGCHHCRKPHHTFLHVNPRLKKDLLGVKGDQPKSTTTVKSTELMRPVEKSTELQSLSIPIKDPTLSELLRQNVTIILPTALVHVESPRHGRRLVRCLLDTGSQFSRIANRVVEDFGLCTLTLESETMCPLKLTSPYDESTSIDGVFRVDNRITMQTPTKSLPASKGANYKNMLLADPQFYESSGIDVIIGVDMYPDILSEGHFSNPGAPPAFSTCFGWVVFGKCFP